jgi:hypothetical protein
MIAQKAPSQRFQAWDGFFVSWHVGVLYHINGSYYRFCNYCSTLSVKGFSSPFLQLSKHIIGEGISAMLQGFDLTLVSLYNTLSTYK